MAGPAQQKISVHSPQNQSERERIYQFRYRALVEHLGIETVFADHQNKFIVDPLDEAAFHLYLMAGGAVIASVRINAHGSTEFSEKDTGRFQFDSFADFKLEEMTMTSRLVLAGGQRQSQVAAVLLGAAYKVARDQYSRFDFTSCTPALVKLYQHLGYRRYAPNFADDDDVYQVPMVMLTEDEAYLRTVKSPVARFCAEHVNTVETSQWFDRAFPGYASQGTELNMDDEKFWEFLTEKMDQTPLEAIPLLKGLSYSEAKRLLRVGTILRAGAGEVIVRAGQTGRESSGQTGREMYVILGGTVEVRAGGRVLTSLGMGSIFGEAALVSEVPRTADIVATEDVEALILTREILQRAMEAMPNVMVKVLFNLSMILAERLRDANAPKSAGSAEKKPAAPAKPPPAAAPGALAPAQAKPAAAAPKPAAAQS